jgi:hypothetical protein
MRSQMLCSGGPHSVWQYALHIARFGPKGWSLQDDASRDEHCTIEGEGPDYWNEIVVYL